MGAKILNLKTLIDANEYCAINGYYTLRGLISEVYPVYGLSDGGNGDEEGSLAIAAIRHGSRQIQFLALHEARHLIDLPKLAVPCGKNLILERVEEQTKINELKRRPAYLARNVDFHFISRQSGNPSYKETVARSLP
jgi:hypothetical protein